MSAQPAIDRDESRTESTPQLKEVSQTRGQSLRESVAIAMEEYFHELDGQPAADIYQMVLAEVEAPLLESVMRHVKGNQTKASIMLGLNRGTLRKKLKQYRINA